MDYSNTIYDSTGQDNFVSLAQASSTYSTYHLNTFMKQLLSTIDVDTLGSIYFRQLSMALPLAKIDLTSIQPNLCFGSESICAPRIVTLPFVDIAGGLGTQNLFASYSFYEDPDRQERNTLATMHQIFTQQLQHALEFKRLKLITTKDALTGLGNRAGFDEACKRLSSRCRRHQEQFALLVIDLDNFKLVNDNHGHQEGDRVLQEVATHIKLALRHSDEAFRFGGDEFCCLLDCETSADLLAVANRLHQLVNNCAFMQMRGISCSIGGAIFHPEEEVDSVFKRADDALYRVKRTGKNAYLAA
ncbi:GGDEF domain-containing protein [Alteromonas sp. ASW11-130]|uniref:GGDEF domain-containing protein n=1 Tax=Alteromonas sp. ASW11-130 TaxID=3015775 RepID=UPI0022427058|nr:GGDEF domain-containing protein [Alteromonas sp. ASW11-130]MCW8091653.1 GGDEF domain-containing protein [Alteromonas sp. ASW11-130]